MNATSKQIGYIHSLATKAGMEDDAYRGFLQRVANVRSSKDLSIASANTVIDKLKQLAGVDGGHGVSGAVAGLNTPVAGKLRALWIAGYDLGLVKDRSDRAMLAFLERQSGVSHTRFLNEPGQATAAIEAIKIWLARDGKVEWPPREARKKDGKADFDEIAASKRAVIDAQWKRLVALCAAPALNSRGLALSLDAYVGETAGKDEWLALDLADYDRVQNALGRKLRAALAKMEPQQ